MLNYIWVGLIIIGIVAALGGDINDQIQNTYRNGDTLAVDMLRADPMNTGVFSRSGRWLATIPSSRFSDFYRLPPAPAADTLRFWVAATTGPDGTGTFRIQISDTTSAIWKKMAKASGTADQLNGRIVFRTENGASRNASLLFDPVTLPRIRAVTRAVLDYASMAVTIAFGLIGIMALWLGVMKIADKAGLVMTVTRILAPVTTRLFPDVPENHPAMAAMVMNMAANMLGLSNAATPFGLKAMDELDTLNPKKGVATNAMVTFLAINTAGLTLIPATALAIRAGIGSANPAIIVGTSIFGAGCATVVGVATAKILQRLPYFRKQLEPAGEEEKSSGTPGGERRGGK